MVGIIYLLAGLLSIGYAFPRDSGQKDTHCLPAGLTQERTVIIPTSGSRSSPATKRIKLKEALIQLGARCKKGKLRDKSGKEIYFFTLTGCWGNPPDNYQQILEKQEQELRRLKKKYAVIQIPCSESDPRMIQ